MTCHAVTNASPIAGRALADTPPRFRRVVRKRSPWPFRRLSETRAALEPGTNLGPIERGFRGCHAVTNALCHRGRNAAPTRPDPTRPISIGCGLSFISKELTKSKSLYVTREARQFGLGAAR